MTGLDDFIAEQEMDAAIDEDDDMAYVEMFREDENTRRSDFRASVLCSGREIDY